MKLNRLQSLTLLYALVFALILIKLFYWQILSSGTLEAIALEQRESTIFLPASRGQILTSDGYPLVSNQPAYLMYAYTPDLEVDVPTLAKQLAPLVAYTPEDLLATPSAELTTVLISEMEATFAAKLGSLDSSWIPLRRDLNKNQKRQVAELGIKGLGFEEYQMRLYPESSMSAQLLGFIGSDGTGKPKGYFGLEGYYDLELTGKSGIIKQEKDALGRPIVIGEYRDIKTRDGRSLKTHLNRSIQLLVETKLKEAIEYYGASSGEVIIMEPQTGAIIALVSYPNYDPKYYKHFDTHLYRLPSITDAYEPGSTFKTLVMAAALNENLITPESTCDTPCSGPVKIGNYQIRTWNNEYHPGQTMTQVLERSDNTGMVNVGFMLGKEKFVEAIKNFGIGSVTGIDLEAESTPLLREDWGDIDLAVGSFGQGLAVTSIQMITAVNSIASGGKLMQPQVVGSVITSEKELPIKPKLVRQVISAKTAAIMTQLMIASAEHGDAQWAIPQGYLIAGKTGTAQIPIAGHYDSEKTVASFVGFAPADNPAFTMLVRLNEPTTSPWASETAAPVWFGLAKDLFVHLGIKPHAN